MHALIESTATPSTELVEPNPFTIPTWTPVNKGWIITNTRLIARIFNPHSNNYIGKHYIYSNLTDRLEPCAGCKLKDKKNETKHCYIILTNHKIHNILVSCKRKIYSDLPDIYSALSSKPPSIPRNPRPEPMGSRPLILFKDPPLTLWESLTSANFKKKENSLKTSHKKSTNSYNKKTYGNMQNKHQNRSYKLLQHILAIQNKCANFALSPYHHNNRFHNKNRYHYQ